jgi:hypothetical protein
MESGVLGFKTLFPQEYDRCRRIPRAAAWSIAHGFAEPKWFSLAKNQQIVWPQKFGSLRQPTPPARDLNSAKFLFAQVIGAQRAIQRLKAGGPTATLVRLGSPFRWYFSVRSFPHTPTVRSSGY